jgi:hypothetical protein
MLSENLVLLQNTRRLKKIRRELRRLEWLTRWTRVKKWVRHEH